MLHEDGHHHVDEDELGHQDEDDEEERGDVLVDAAVAETVLGVITLLPQSVLHDPVPVVTCRMSRCHSRCPDVRIQFDHLESELIFQESEGETEEFSVATPPE